MRGVARKLKLPSLFKPSTVLYLLVSFVEPLWAGPSHESQVDAPHPSTTPAGRAIEVSPLPRVLPSSTVLPKGKGKLVGTVERLDGNFIPGRGPTSGKVIPLSVPVHIFRGIVSSGRGRTMTAPDTLDPRIVKVLQSDETGRFETELPSGDYTVFAEINHQLYLNSLDHNLNYSHLTIEEGKETHSKIVESSKAGF